MLVCAAAFLGIGAPAASAAPEAGEGWSFRNSFGTLGVGTYDPVRNSAAVDGSGNIFAVEENFGTVAIFSPSGEALSTLSIYPTGLPRNIAIDTDDGTLYADEVSSFGGTVITRWTSDGQPVPTYTQDTGFSVPQGEGIAVDPASSDLLVADPGAEGVRRYDTSGTLLGTIATPGITPAWIATLPDGSFLVAPAEGPDVTHFSGAGTQLGSISGVGQLHGLAFDSVRSVVVASVGDTLKTYSLTGELRSESPRSGSESLGLVVDGSSGVLYEHGGGAVNAYVPAVIPGVELPIISDITADSAHLSAEVDPGAGPPEGSAAHFEYSEDGGTEWKELPNQPVERTPTDEPATIEADLEGLKLNSDFLVRVKAFNSLASKTSAAVPFSTPEIAPLVTTAAASERTETSAVLNGTVNPVGLLSTYHFEYGTTTAYGNRMPVASEASAGNLRSPRSVAVAIEGLQPGTTYHYRLVASNAIGETAGADMTFTTITADEAFPQRAYEQVTPTDKRGAQVASEFHVQVGTDGSWIAAATASGSTDSEANRMRQNFLIRREATDWSDWAPIDAPQKVDAGIFESSTTGVSPDGTHALVVSNRDLAPGGIEGGGNLYDKDLRTGEYTFVGGAPGTGAYNALANGLENETIFLAAGPEFDWLLFFAPIPLISEEVRSAVYRWTPAEGLSIESKIPDTLDPSQTVVSAAAQKPGAYQLAFPMSSADGNVVAFGTSDPFQSGAVFRRADGVTTAVSVSHRAEDEGTLYAATFDGMSADGRYVFFHTGALLTEDAQKGSPTGTEEPAYRYDAQTDSLTFLMVVVSGSGVTPMYGLSSDGSTVYYGTDQGVSVWNEGDVQLVTTGSTFNMYYTTQNGRFFGWVNSQAHLFDAETGQSACVSCTPVDGSTPKTPWIGLNARTIGNTEPGIVTEDGTMFFDTASPLVSGDLNGKRDVYAYKDGRLALISPGDQSFDAVFVGASDEGRDVFFQTDQGLVSRDVDGETDVYDARIGGGFPNQNPPPAPPPCVRAGCDETSSGPVASPPVSSQRVTADKAKPKKRCKKGYVKKTVKGKQRCVKKPKAKKKVPKRQAGQSRTFGK